MFRGKDNVDQLGKHISTFFKMKAHLPKCVVDKKRRKLLHQARNDDHDDHEKWASEILKHSQKCQIKKNFI